MRSTSEVLETLRVALAQIPSADLSLGLNSSLVSSSAAQLRLLGPDLDKLIDLVNQAETIIQTVPGVVDLRNKGAERLPETQILINRQRATDLGQCANCKG